MSLKLSKNNTPAYDYLSEGGTMVNPAVCSIVIDKTGGERVSDTLTLYLVAIGDEGIASYKDIDIRPDNAVLGLGWELSLDGTDWRGWLTPAHIECLETTVIIPIYVRVRGDNSDTTDLVTDNYEGILHITAVEAPIEIVPV